MFTCLLLILQLNNIMIGFQVDSMQTMLRVCFFSLSYQIMYILILVQFGHSWMVWRWQLHSPFLNIATLATITFKLINIFMMGIIVIDFEPVF